MSSTRATPGGSPECLGHLGKTDRLDARALAEYGRVVSDLPPTTPRKESLNRLEDLMVMRNAFVDRRAELRQTRSEMADPAAKAAAKRGLDVDGRAIAALDAEIEALVKADPELRQRYYADAVKQAGHRITLNNDEKTAATNVKAMERAFERKGLGKFGQAEKAAAVLVLIDAWGKAPSEVPEPTQEKARMLIDAINTQFDRRS